MESPCQEQNSRPGVSPLDAPGSRVRSPSESKATSRSAALVSAHVLIRRDCFSQSPETFRCGPRDRSALPVSQSLHTCEGSNTQIYRHPLGNPRFYSSWDSGERAVRLSPLQHLLDIHVQRARPHGNSRAVVRVENGEW